MGATLVPEFYVTDIARSLSFYVGTLGFRVLYQRPAERFAYLDRDGAELMIEQTVDSARLFLRAPLEHPFGRGMHLQIQVAHVQELLDKVEASGARLIRGMEERWYRRDDRELGTCQFWVEDPDGYVLRFYEDLGSRPVAKG